MRGFTLLCLVGYILIAADAQCWKLPGGCGPMGNSEVLQTRNDTIELTANAVGIKPPEDGKKWPPGTTGPMSNKDGFNTTTKSSVAPAESGGHNETNHWNGTTQPIENNYGFPPPPADGEKTKVPKEDTVPRTTKKPKTGVHWHPLSNKHASPGDATKNIEVHWHPLGNEHDFPPAHSDGDATKDSGGFWHPMSNVDDFPPAPTDGDATKGKES